MNDLDLNKFFERIRIVFWDWNLSNNNILLKTLNYDDRSLIFNKPENTKSEFLKNFSKKSKDEFEKVIKQYLKKERNHHQLISEIIHDNRISCIALNTGYSLEVEDSIILRGILLNIKSLESEQDYFNEVKKILQNISLFTEEEFWIRDLELNFLFISKPFSNVFQYSSEELLKIQLEKLYTSESIYYLKHNIEEALKFYKSRKVYNDKNLILILKGFTSNGKLVWSEESFNFIRNDDDEIIGFWGFSRDVTKKIKADQIKEALYKISEYSNLTSDLNDFFTEVHSIIKAIMPANNFTICLYEKENEFISCPYSSNFQYQKNLYHKFSNGIVEYGITSGKPLHLDKNSLLKIISDKNLETKFEIPEDWISIPLRIRNEITGLLFVECFNDKEKFSQEDVEHLKFVADHTSILIERKINESDKQKVKSLLEAVSKAQSSLLTKRDIFVGIQLAFEQIGNILNINRILLYENTIDVKTNSHSGKLFISWTSHNLFQDGILDSISFSSNFKRWLEQFNLGSYIIGNINRVPLLEYELLKNTKTKSFLCIPIFLTKRLWGFIELDDCKNERIWSEQEISILTVVAASIGGILQRKIAEETLKTSEEKYRNFINNSMEGISLLQFTEPIDITLPIEEQIDKIYEYGYIAEANQSLAKMYGLSSTSDIVGQTLINIHGGSNIPENRKAFRDFIENGYKVINVETIEKKVDGSEIIILNNSVGILSDKKLKAIWGTQIDITERKKFEKELMIAKDKAEEAIKIKSSFLSNMSHELRTPLIGVLGYAEILMEEFKNTPYEEMASIIHQSGNRLLETLNSILTISKIESEKFAINNSLFNIKDVINEVFNIFNSIALKKNLKVIIDCPDEKMLIYSDSKIIREILNNLVNNAIKYTIKGFVKIKSYINSELNRLYLVVEDTGIGIPAEKIEIIFEEFRQVSEGLSRSFEGVGLGLSICKRYVEILGGKIYVESKVNEGSIFTVEIPLNKFE
jgi:PAS domain S-box-containing protein